MNEKIKSFMLQAGTDTSGKWMSVDDAEKFAELIVRECVDNVLDCSVEYTTRPQIAQELKEHFGIE